MVFSEKRNNLLALIVPFFGFFYPMNGIPGLFERSLEFCKGKVPDDQYQFWSEWLKRGRLLFEQRQASPTHPLAVDFATTPLPPTEEDIT